MSSLIDEEQQHRQGSGAESGAASERESLIHVWRVPWELAEVAISTFCKIIVLSYVISDFAKISTKKITKNSSVDSGAQRFGSLEIGGTLKILLERMKTNLV